MIRTYLRQKHRVWLYLFLALAFVLLVALPAGAEDVLQSTLSSMQESEQWWDKLWQDTFDPQDLSNNISIYTFMTAVRFILAVGLIFWMFQYGQKMAESKGTAQVFAITGQSLLPVVLVILFLSNQGQNSRLLAYGLRDVVNSWSNGAMSMQIAGQTLRAALSDQLVTQDVKDQIAAAGDKCMQMPQPGVALPSATRPTGDAARTLTLQQQQAYDYLECLKKLESFAKQKKQEGLTKNCPNFVGARGTCKFFRRFIDQTIATTRRVLENEGDKLTGKKSGIFNPFGPSMGLRDYLIGVGASIAYGPVLYFTQWLWMSFLEMAMWLSALFAPLFIAAAIVPGRQNLTVTWFVGFLTIGLAKLAYIVVMGIVAAQLSDRNTILASDMRFPMALGLFAPGVSFAVVTAGGLAAASSFRNQSITVVGAATSVVAGALSTMGYSLSRYLDRRR